MPASLTYASGARPSPPETAKPHAENGAHPVLDRDSTVLVTGAAGFTADLASLLQRVDAVCHLTGQPGVRESWGTSFETHLRVDVLACQRLIGRLPERPTRKVIASSSWVCGRDFLYGEDAVAATLAALGAPSPAYNVAEALRPESTRWLR